MRKRTLDAFDSYRSEMRLTVHVELFEELTKLNAHTAVPIMLQMAAPYQADNSKPGKPFVRGDRDVEMTRFS